MSAVPRFLLRALPANVKVKFRPLVRPYQKLITALWFPLRVVRIFPYVWRTEMNERLAFPEIRAAHEHEYTDTNESPLISIILPTYNRAELLMTRAIPSIQAQTYQNFEVVIIGDCCSDDTGERIAALNDPRFTFYNLPDRTVYPQSKVHFWMTVAYRPMTVGRERAQGKWLASMDDDDIWMPEHLEKLLRYCQRNNLEFASSQSLMELSSGEYRVKGEPPPLSYQQKTHCTFFSRTYLRVFKYERHSWRANRSIDKHLLGKYRRAGVRAGFLEDVTAYYLLSNVGVRVKVI